MLSYCDVQQGEFALHGGRLYYRGNVISPEDPRAMISWGGEQIFVFPIEHSLVPYVVVVQASPVGVKIHPCTEFSLKTDKIVLLDTDGKWYGYKKVGGYVYPHEDEGYFRIYPFTPEKK